MSTILDSHDEDIFTIRTTAKGVTGQLPFQEEFLANAPSGDLFGWTQNVGMGWDPSKTKRKRFRDSQHPRRDSRGGRVGDRTRLSHRSLGSGVAHASGGERDRDGRRSSVRSVLQRSLRRRSQGTTGMFDSLPYRNDAATIFRRQIRSLPTAKGVLGVATCDKGLPAMAMALAGTLDLPCILVPGGVSLISEDAEDLGKVQTIGSRFAQGEISLEHAAHQGCKACSSGGGGCQFLGTAASSQVVAEALGMTLPHAALCPSGADVWLDMAKRSARALLQMKNDGLTNRKMLSQDSIENAMVVHAAFGCSTNLIMHLPAIAHAAKLDRPTVEDWRASINSSRASSTHYPTDLRCLRPCRSSSQAAVPEVMLHLREAGLLKLEALTASGQTLGENLEWWRSPNVANVFARN